MKSCLLFLSCLLVLTTARGPKCDDGTKPTCADGSKPQRVRGQPPCPEGRPKTCEDGSTPSIVGGGRPKGGKEKQLELTVDKVGLIKSN